MSKGLERRKQFFDKFSNQLLLLQKNGILDMQFKYERPYLCPICLSEFTDTDIHNDSENFLTLEDAPPDSLSGSKIALTCKKCNSECGHQIDNHLTEILRAIDASYFYKGSKHFGTITHEGQKITVELTSQGDGTLTAYHRIKQNNPTLLDKFIYGLKNKTIGPILNLQPPKIIFSSKRVNYALVKANYIITFSKFGYIFLLNRKYDSIRQQLLNPDKEIYLWTPFIKDQFTNDKVGIYYVHNNGAQSIFNIFSLKTDYSETLIGGLLPVPTIPISEFVKNIYGQKNHESEVILDTTKYDPDADLFNDINEINKIVCWIAKTKSTT
jgi:hypothetical protein